LLFNLGGAAPHAAQIAGRMNPSLGLVGAIRVPGTLGVGGSRPGIQPLHHKFIEQQGAG